MTGVSSGPPSVPDPQAIAALLVRATDPIRLEKLPPLYVVHTVHGTWARKASWPDPNSPFGIAIRKGLGWRARIEPLRWSGRNQMGARKTATDALRAHLRQKFAEFPDARHFVVGHSHGGNIALMAADRREIADHLSGVVTLSTPFLTARVRDFTPLLDGPTTFIAAVSSALGYMSWRLYQHDTWASAAPQAFLVFAVALAILACGAWAVRGMHRRAVRLNEQMPRTRLTPDKVAIIRVQGDEPIAVIAAVRLAGTIAELIHQKIDGILGPLARALVSLGRYARLPAGLEAVLGKLTPEQPVWKPGHATVTPMPPSPLIQLVRSCWPIGLSFLVEKVAAANPVVHYLLLALALLYGLPSAFAVVVVGLGVPVAFISALSLVMTGAVVPLAGPYLDLAAEASPPGEWTVTNLECRRDDRGLLHSEIHGDARLAGTVVSWIAARPAAK